MLGGLLVGAFALRITWVLYAAREPTGFSAGDPLAYLYYGRELAAGHGYRSFVTHAPTAFYPIGYPLFIALFAWPAQHGWLPDDVTRLVASAQAVLGTATVLCVWVIGRRLFGPRVALVAAALTACWPGLVLMTGSLNLETVFVALLMGSVAVLVSGAEGEELSRRRLLITGALLGLSALVRPFSLPVLAALAIGVLVARGGRSAVRAVAWTAVPVALVLAPWIARNERELGTTALSTNMGDTLCLDHREGATGHFSFPPECFSGFDAVPLANLEQVRNREDANRAFAFVREHPASELRLVFVRARYMVEGDHDGLTGVESGGADPFLPAWLRTSLRLSADWWYWITLALAVFAVPALFRRGTPNRSDRLIVGLTAAALIAIPLELYGYTRFHIPLLPFQAIAAAFTIVAVRDLAARRAQHRS
ncbi:MAG TPA: glycosyltransferase family 39 protein [Acidimicrobiales bacterium]|nr:glycosyltransferase family 39 protein [Acidimicrobiales bacterium]